MLVLSRKIGESLMVNNDLEIRIIEISGDKVKIGIEAPKQFRVLRKELCMTVETNKEAAARARTKDLLDFIGKLDLNQSPDKGE